ncbi:hypothetical protein H920_18553 [Fukomys damarensis]|uniref:Uncharacterized protein n=1 Tax=Fukomys damarensis TaxID=885580 RepID=A0A091CPN8_FUKDA|nr:hypothetical protein H920_18553 [Fukomys damarensis]
MVICTSLPGPLVRSVPGPQLWKPALVCNPDIAGSQVGMVRHRQIGSSPVALRIPYSPPQPQDCKSPDGPRSAVFQRRSRREWAWCGSQLCRMPQWGASSAAPELTAALASGYITVGHRSEARVSLTHRRLQTVLLAQLICQVSLNPWSPECHPSGNP